MNAEELQQVERTAELPAVLNVECLGNRAPRTLLFGYDSDATVLHTYLSENGRIECIRYTYLAEGVPVLMSSADDRVITSNSAYVPEKYALPEASDAEFCKYLKLSGVPIRFAVLNAKSRSEQYHGLRLDYFREHVESLVKTGSTAEVGVLGLI